MEPERIKELVIRGLLGLIGLYLIVRVFTTLAGGPMINAPGVQFTPARFDTTLLTWEPVYYQLTSAKDPFVPYPLLVEEKPPPMAFAGPDTIFMVEQFQGELILPPTGLVVSGIIQGRSRKSALINGGTYYLGDQIDGYRIVDITNDKVLLEKGGVQFSLRLGGS